MEAAVQEKGSCTLVLSGGSTPQSLYSLLADGTSWRNRAPWDKTYFFWGDERRVMTAPVLNNAACLGFLVSGDEKALPLKAVLEGRYEPEQLPAQLIQPSHGRLLGS